MAPMMVSKMLSVLLVCTVLLSGCGLFGGGVNVSEQYPPIPRPDVSAFVCGENNQYVCFTEEDAITFFKYVNTLETQYEAVR